MRNALKPQQRAEPPSSGLSRIDVAPGTTNGSRLQRRERHSRACSISGQFDIGEAGFGLRYVAVSEFPLGLMSWWSALAVRGAKAPPAAIQFPPWARTLTPSRLDAATITPCMPPTAHPQIGKGRCQVDNCGSLLAGFCRRDKSATETLVSFWPLVFLRCVKNEPCFLALRTGTQTALL
jgi:hypothetical protein